MADAPSPSQSYAASPDEGAQLNLFDERILQSSASQRFRLVGQVFGTYWIIEYEDAMLLIDQHAAHEKVKFTRMMEAFREREIDRQLCSPPLVVTLDGAQQATLAQYREALEKMGFEIEDFGARDFCIRTVPSELYGLAEKDLFYSILDALAGSAKEADASSVYDRIAMMSCKAAVKGNHALSWDEARSLIAQLLELPDPYTCPHGRPTVIRMTKRELEKKFGRIV